MALGARSPVFEFSGKKGDSRGLAGSRGVSRGLAGSRGVSRCPVLNRKIHIRIHENQFSFQIYFEIKCCAFNNILKTTLMFCKVVLLFHVVCVVVFYFPNKKNGRLKLHSQLQAFKFEKSHY